MFLRRRLALARLIVTWRSFRIDQRGVAAIEFALIGLSFLLLLFFIFEISLDLFQQEALDAALHLAVRQIQTGAAQNTANGQTFIEKYVCPNITTVLTCSNINVQVKKLGFGDPLVSTGSDFYTYTTDSLPMTAGALDLGGFGSAKFCNSGPAQFLLVTLIYTSPSIIGNLLPNLLTVSYNGRPVHATMSQMGTVTENFPVASPTSTTAAAC